MKLGLGWHSFTEEIFSTETVHASNMHAYLDIISSIKSLKHSKVTKDGIESARGRGIQIGRPGIPHEAEREIIRLRQLGYSYSQISEEVTYVDSKGISRNVSKSTIHVVLKKHLSVFEKGGDTISIC